MNDLTLDEALNGRPGMHPKAFEEALSRFLQDPDNRRAMDRELGYEEHLTGQIRRQLRDQPPEDWTLRFFGPND